MIRRRSWDVILEVIVALLALAAPICTSLYLARLQSLSVERDMAVEYARDVMRRALETREEFRRAANELNSDGLPACSAAEINVMRRLDLASSYIQALGRIENNELTCTSLGTNQELNVGPPSLINDDGVAERYNVSVSLAPAHPLTVISMGGVAALLDPYLLVNTPTAGEDISIAVFVPSMPSHGLLSEHGAPPSPATLQPIAKGEELTVVNRDAILSRVRAKDADLEVIVSVPNYYINRRVRNTAMIYVPIGLLCGAGLVWAVVAVFRRRLSMEVLLRTAARRGEFVVEYQPVVELSTRRWIGAEALVRWQRDDRLIRPDLFIPIAEEAGIVNLITECVAASVSADLPKLLQVDPAFKVAINLSIADITSPRTLALLRETVDRANAFSEPRSRSHRTRISSGDAR